MSALVDAYMLICEERLSSSSVLSNEMRTISPVRYANLSAHLLSHMSVNHD